MVVTTHQPTQRELSQRKTELHIRMVGGENTPT